MPAITIETARSQEHWSDARHLMLEYLECATAGFGIGIADVSPHVWLEVGDPSARYGSPGSLLLVARGEGEPVGIAGLHLHGDTAEVVRMYVRPQYRGRGVAIALLDRLRDEALRRGTRRLRLTTDPVSMAAAARLYRRYGFRIVGAHMNQHVEFLDMELMLGPPNPA